MSFFSENSQKSPNFVIITVRHLTIIFFCGLRHKIGIKSIPSDVDMINHLDDDACTPVKVLLSYSAQPHFLIQCDRNWRICFPSRQILHDYVCVRK
jgi:hypothetical protein